MEPLDCSRREIRLFKLYERDESDPIEGTLEIHSLDNEPTYSALSYAWGDPAVTANILVNGRSLLVTVNLEAALLTISSNFIAKVPRQRAFEYLWVDAICINQSDTAERNSQVQLMPSIYKQASFVLAWLGPAQDNSSDVIGIAKRMAADISTSNTEDLDLEWLQKPQYQELLNDFKHNSPASSVAFSNWASFSQLFSKRSYWKRAWVLQELVLAKAVFFTCGSDIFVLDDVQCIARWLHRLQDLPVPSSIDHHAWTFLTLELPIHLRKFEELSMYRRTLHTDDWSAYDFVCSSIPRLATDPRDKIYCLLGMRDLGILPDYSKRVEEIYIETIKILAQGVALDKVLSLSGRGWFKSDLRLPSWVPDWDGLSKLTTINPLNGSWYSADQAHSNVPDYRHQIIGETLAVSGVVVDEVEFVSPDLKEPLPNMEATFLFDLAGNGLPDGAMHLPKVPPGVSKYAASLRLFLEDTDFFTRKRLVTGSATYWRIGKLFFNVLKRLDKFEHCEGIVPSHGDFKTIISLLLGEDHVTLSPEDGAAVIQALLVTEDRDILPRLSYNLALHATKRAHFYTKGGYIGFGPRGLERGDLVYIIQGSRLPIILRCEENHYIHVCSCFILGLMDGEKVGLMNGDVEWERMDIR